MNKEEIKNKIKDIIVDENYVDASEVTDTANFEDDLGLDSFDLVYLIIKIEKEFSISISDDEAEKVSCLNDCVELAEKYVNQK